MTGAKTLQQQPRFYSRHSGSLSTARVTMNTELGVTPSTPEYYPITNEATTATNTS